MPVMTARSRTRLAHGLCPRCGAEAAPYYLCDQCRYQALIRRICNRMEARGLVTTSVEGQTKVYQMTPEARARPAEQRPSVYHEAREGDGRLKPRLRRIPIDIEKELLRLFLAEGIENMVTYEEIMHAWGTLRLRPGRQSAALDMAAIIRAERRRQRKQTKRAAAVAQAMPRKERC